MRSEQMLTEMFVLFLLAVHPSDGAAYFSTDPCPQGVAPGGSWVPSSGGCMRCSCSLELQGYSCYSCGVVMIQPSHQDCYTAYTHPNAAYPDCCRVGEVCPGDPGYDASHTNHNGVVGR